MFAVERQNEILDYLKEEHSASVSELASKFFISEATVRRDLDKLAKGGQIKRTHGGAVINDGSANDSPFILRDSINSDAKNQIAQICAKYIKSGDTILLDSSSTALKVIPYIEDPKGITVITNGIKTMAALCEKGVKNIYSCGGHVRENSYSLTGATAAQYLSVFSADTYIFSCSGLSLTAGVTERSEEEATIKRIMFDSAKTRILLCDSSKLNTISLSRVCNINDVDLIISEKPLPKEYLDQMNG